MDTQLNLKMMIVQGVAELMIIKLGTHSGESVLDFVTANRV